jgi:hypothetical protein
LSKSHTSCSCTHGRRSRSVVGRRHQAQALNGSPEPDASAPTFDSTALPASFCIIEDRSTVQDFAKLQLDEIKTGIRVRLPKRCAM